jgi:hypothetical protein
VDLAHTGWLSGVGELDLSCNSICEAGFEALAASPHLGALELLDLEGNRAGPRAGLALAGSTRLGRLRKLRLGGCQVGDAGVVALAASDRFPQLFSLDLAYSGMSLQGLHAVLNPSGVARLRCLELGEESWPAEVWSLEPAPRLRGSIALHLLGGDVEVDAVADSPLLAACRALGWVVGDPAGATRLACSPAVRGLRTLRLVSCDLGDSEAQALAKSPYLAELRDLSLENGNFSHTGIAALLAASFVPRLSVLDLSRCRLERVVALRRGGDWWDRGRPAPHVRQQLEERFGPRVVLE